jgi:hypothetical protein
MEEVGRRLGMKVRECIEEKGNSLRKKKVGGWRLEDV